MEISEKDLMLNQIQSEIEKINKYLQSKRQEIKKTKKENKFLEMVHDDYEQYYNYIKEQKQQQINQMEFILKYLEKSMKEAGLTEQKVRQTKHEQRTIIKKIKQIKKELDEIIKDDE